MCITLPFQSTQTAAINDHIRTKQNDDLSCYQSFIKAISSLRSTLSKITCWKKQSDQQSAPLISTSISRLKISSSLQAEIIQSANARVLKRYGEETIKTAEKWGTNDLASVEVILQCLPKEVAPPDNPNQIYLFRSQKKTSKNIDLEKCLVRNNPASEALINDNHLLDLHPTRDKIARLEAKAKHMPTPHVLKATKKTAGISNANSYQVTKIVAPDEAPARISGIQGVLPHGGINFLVSIQPNIENRYGLGSSDSIHLRVNLKSIFDTGGKIYKDISAAVWHAVIVELPSNIDGISYLDMSTIAPDRKSTV